MQPIEIIFPRPGEVEVRECALPEPGPGQVRCRMVRSLISTGTETICLRGSPDPGTNWSEWVRYPFQPGYSAVGVVEAIGAGVAGLRVGQRVGALVSHRSHFVIDAASAIALPDDVSDDDATWMALAVVAQVGVRRAELQLGEAAGVVGLGILGQLVVQYLALMGARLVVAIDVAPARLAMARASGAGALIEGAAADARERVRELTGGRMLDVAFDVTGSPAVLAGVTPLARQLGRVVLLGDTSTPSLQTVGPRVVADSISILGIHGTQYPREATPFNPWTQRAMAELFFDFVAQGRMRVGALVTHRAEPEQAPQIYAQLLRDRSAFGGVIFEWE